MKTTNKKTKMSKEFRPYIEGRKKAVWMFKTGRMTARNEKEKLKKIEDFALEFEKKVKAGVIVIEDYLAPGFNDSEAAITFIDGGPVGGCNATNGYEAFIECERAYTGRIALDF